MPEISVVIPCYNRAALIGRAVESVRAQNFADLEIVIVDDGSKDDSVSVIERLAADEPRIRLVRHPRNRGEAAARNTGMREARGRLIAFLDSDDSWLEGKLERTCKAMADPDVAAVVTGNIVVMPDGDRMYDDAWHFHEPITVRTLLVKGCSIGLGGNVLMRRDAALAAGPFDETLKLYVDVDWLCRFLDGRRMIAINEPYTIYYKAPLRDGDAVAAAADVFQAKNAALIGRFSARDRRLIRAQFHENVAACHKASGNRGGFLRASFKSLMARPLRRPGVYVELIEIALGLNLRQPVLQMMGRGRKSASREQAS